MGSGPKCRPGPAVDLHLCSPDPSFSDLTSDSRNSDSVPHGGLVVVWRFSAIGAEHLQAHVYAILMHVVMPSRYCLVETIWMFRIDSTSETLLQRGQQQPSPQVFLFVGTHFTVLRRAKAILNLCLGLSPLYWLPKIGQYNLAPEGTNPFPGSCCCNFPWRSRSHFLPSLLRVDSQFFPGILLSRKPAFFKRTMTEKNGTGMKPRFARFPMARFFDQRPPLFMRFLGNQPLEAFDIHVHVCLAIHLIHVKVYQVLSPQVSNLGVSILVWRPNKLRLVSRESKRTLCAHFVLGSPLASFWARPFWERVR